MTRLSESIIDDEFRLNELKNICFTAKDLRAGWIGAGIPGTNQPNFQALAKWATEHWYMYESFLPEISFNPGNILDIGCGIGHSTINLATIFPEKAITAIDNDQEAIAFARKYNNKSNISYIAQDIFHYSNPDKFQYIFCLEIFEHLPPASHDLFIEHCLSLMKPEGKMFMTTPNALDEKDADYGHIGMLNRQRALGFYKRYHKNIITESFINNTKLLSGNPKNFTIQEPFNTYDRDPDQKSHFRLIFKTTPDTYHRPPGWNLRFFFVSTKLKLKNQGNNAIRYMNRILIYIIPLIPEPLLKVYRKIRKRPISIGQSIPERKISISSPNSETPVNWHENFIVHLASILKPEVYVELGLYQCELFNQIVPYSKKLFGVDIKAAAGTFMEKASGKSEFFHGTTDSFAQILGSRNIVIDLLFIDANHSKESVLADFHNYFPHVRDQGLILLHDAYPKNVQYADPGYCGDGYKAIAELAKKTDTYEMMTIPQHPGIAICRKRRSQLPWI